MKMFGLSPLMRENLGVAVKSIRSNRLRSFLTILIIAIGITSLVGVLTATDALKSEVFSSFEKMGTTSFSISAKRVTSASRRSGARIRNSNIISYPQARLFKREFDSPAVVAIYTVIYNLSIKYGGETANPTIYTVAADEDYLNYKNCTIASGRNLSASDIASASFVCILGPRVASMLVKNGDPLGKFIQIGGIRYEIVGITAGIGSSFGQSVDNEVIIPVSNARSHFVSDNTSYIIGVVPSGGAYSGTDSGHALLESDGRPDYSSVYGRAEHLFRSIRRLSPTDETDFSLNRSDAVLGELDEIMGIITIAAIVIGLVTLLGAAIGLMNIMLVSVKERTREIGIRKAIGASSSLIRQQFLMESVVISQAGCLSGIIFGVLIGNGVAVLMGASFIMPWTWCIFAVVVCFAVGVLSGYIPAQRAAALDPIESLRYE